MAIVRTRLPRILPLGLASCALLLLAGNMHRLETPLAFLFPHAPSLLYDRSPFMSLLLEHLVLVLMSSGLAVAVGCCLGITVTRPAGRDFLPVADALASVGQTFPPVAVLALAVPMVGFGTEPTIIALFIYGLFPVLRNTVTGLEGVPEGIRDAARGMGMTQWQALAQVELRTAMPMIMAGVRTSVVINIGTATLGATIGAGGLGEPILAGLATRNPAFVLQGALVVGCLAVVVDGWLGLAQATLGEHAR
ncbi:ABC-type proline/glycine betaine transport system, permease component [Desulfocurvibacter africanus PCS]|uniref:ABC-type proline/glycine betaine transport system, permease component n=1 Tax=Desulfocurvibacter africanus PCS TaxID=1262666 RepID=M5Q3Q9_DESAF|nr:ABC transporter permease [Desulfocurvibacter africanus]EMG38878.1 ABC-type proline/glycine betaine transport system, permease component [Desulfocurvibacter africanus PCS]